MDNYKPKIVESPLTRAEISRNWRKNNPERHKELYNKYYNERKEFLREYQKEWRRNAPEYTGGNRKGYLNTEEGWSRYKTNSLKSSAKKRGLEFSITYEDILKIMVKRCPVVGIDLDYSLMSHKGKMLPNSPHIDRIDNTKGYIKGNIIIVSGVVNKVKSDLKLNEIAPIMLQIIEFYGKYGK